MDADPLRANAAEPSPATERIHDARLWLGGRGLAARFLLIESPLAARNAVFDVPNGELDGMFRWS